MTRNPATGSGAPRRRPRRSASAASSRAIAATPVPVRPPATQLPPSQEPPSLQPGGAPAPRPDDLVLDSPPASEHPPFAHASEAEMARILDFYQVRWEYEPHTFPIVWNLDGAVVESFSPDFWLPDLGLYLEMTTLRQKLVRKKNRKLRRVLELYPDLRVKLFYARDFRALMLKFGKLALVDELSGTPGQVVHERPLREAVEDDADGLEAGE